jgi:hypothetical protein
MITPCALLSMLDPGTHPDHTVWITGRAVPEPYEGAERFPDFLGRHSGL